jgi:uncharacterized protein (TIGR04255 family)
MYRFRREPKGYPLIQVGPGVITLNTIDAKYDWKSYYEMCQTLIQTAIKLNPLSVGQYYSPNLIYIDFFKLDFRSQDAISFLNQNLKINFGQSFYKNKSFPTAITSGFSYETEHGLLNVLLSEGKNEKQESGLVIKTQVSGPQQEPRADAILGWLDGAHEFCSTLFEDMTKGQLFESFK